MGSMQSGLSHLVGLGLMAIVVGTIVFVVRRRRDGSRRSPLRIALWSLAITLFAGGLVGTVSSRAAADTSSDTEDTADTDELDVLDQGDEADPYAGISCYCSVMPPDQW